MADDPTLRVAMGGYADGVDATIAQRTADDVLLAVDEADALVAYVTVHPRLGTHGVVHFCVSPEARGHGERIFRAAVQELARRGITHVIAPPSPTVEPDVQERIWRRLGFETRYYGEHYA